MTKAYNTKMKDLKHYFVSPPKSIENVETVTMNDVENSNSSRIVLEADNDEVKEVRTTTAENPNANNNMNRRNTEIETASSNIIEDKKRSRVKIRISLKDTKKNSRCDIIESINDFVDKTPSPFDRRNNKTRRKSKTTVNDKDQEEMANCSNALEIENEEEKLIKIEQTTTHTTPNAFHVLMTSRNKFLNNTNRTAEKNEDGSGSTLTPLSRLSDNKNYSNEKNSNKTNKLKERRENNNLVQGDKKNDKQLHPKRKLEDVEEIEFVSNNIKKPAKLFRRDAEKKTKEDKKEERDIENRDTKNGNGNKNKRKKQKKIVGKERIQETFVSLNNNDNNDNNVRKEKREGKKERTKNKNNNDNDLNDGGSSRSKTRSSTDRNNDNDREKIHISQSQYSFFTSHTPLGGKTAQITPKSKTKWTMRVKLQSQSDIDEDNFEIDKTTGDTGMTSDDDHIFTPRNKAKYRKKRIRKTTGEGGSEGEQIETEMENQKREKTEEFLSQNSSSSSSTAKHSNHKINIKKNGSKLKISTENNLTTKSDQNIDKIILDRSVEILVNNDPEDSNSGCEILQEKKLAPLFVKRTKPNPEIIAARKSFLKSGVPETVKKLISEQKSVCNDPGISIMPFPIVSHVSQLEIDENLEIESKDRSVKSFYKQKLDLNQGLADFSLDSGKFKSLSNFGDEISLGSEKTDAEKLLRINTENFETVLKEVESRCSDTRKIWESVLSTSSNKSVKRSPKKRTKKLKLQRKSEVLESVEENPENLNPTWICKYKPTSSAEVVGNEMAIAKLKNWLSGWRLPSFKDDRSSGDEFYSSDGSNSSYYENNQVAVLIGPHGSGKTASVYAIAEELGYRVLEVNASSRRTGKKLLSEFQEATKSHRIKRDQSTLLPAKKRPLEKKVHQNSLILIEDIDLIFEEDEGFVTATFQLAANTRRPIVMTCREACPHLNKMAPQQQFINFQTATGNRVSALLELIALAESGYRLSRSCLDTLLRNGDLRQSLLQLQYILLSGPPSFSQLGLIPGSTLWPDIYPLIYKPAIKSSKKNRKEGKLNKTISEEDKNLCETLADKLYNVTLISSLTEVENPASPPWERRLNPSLSVLEDFQSYSRSVDLGIEISNWLRTASLGSAKAILKSREINYDSKSQLSIKRKVKIGVDAALSQAIPSSLDLNRVSKSTDYLPVIRNICRSEIDRASINNKRGNRFHNYLHGLNLASASNNILSAASGVLRDKDRDK